MSLPFYPFVLCISLYNMFFAAFIELHLSPWHLVNWKIYQVLHAQDFVLIICWSHWFWFSQHSRLLLSVLFLIRHSFQPLTLFISSGSPDDWECFQHYLDCLLEDGSYWCNELLNDSVHPPKDVERNSSHLTDEVVHVYDFCIMTIILDFIVRLCIFQAAFYSNPMYRIWFVQIRYAVYFSFIKCISLCTKVTSRSW